MPRLPEITRREQVPEDQRHHFDSIMASRGAITGPYVFLLHTPDMAARIAHTLGYSRFETSLNVEVKELAICTVARELDCTYEWAAHEDEARNAGVREEAISAIRGGVAPEGLTPDEAQVVTYAQALLRSPHRVDQAAFEALRERLGDAHLVELTATIGAYVMLACCLNAADVPPPEGRPVLPT